MNNSTSIKYSEVREGVAVIKEECLPKMKNIFSEFENTMNRVGGQDVFVGEASESLQSRFTKLQSKFSEFERLVLQFAAEYEKASASTESTESKLAEEAGNLDA